MKSIFSFLCVALLAVSGFAVEPDKKEETKPIGTIVEPTTQQEVQPPAAPKKKKAHKAKKHHHKHNKKSKKSTQ